MAKSFPPSLVLYDYPGRPDLATISIPFDRELQSRLRSEAPGCRYAPEVGKGKWAGPRELKGTIASIALERGLQFIDKTKPIRKRSAKLRNLDERLYSYQEQGVGHILDARGYMLAYDTGMGKTPPTCQALATVSPKKTLIVTPAMVRLQWIDEIEKWWPNHPEVTVVETGKQAKEVAQSPGPVTVVSYNMAVYFKDAKFDALVGDEFHHVMNQKAAMSAAVCKIFENNHEGHRIALTATPIMTRPWQIRHQLHCLYPYRYGGHWAFAERYCKMVLNEHGRGRRVETPDGEVYYEPALKPEGIDPEFASELQMRLALVMQRVTKEEYGHLLPKWNIMPIKVAASRKSAKVMRAFRAARRASDLKDSMIADLTSEKMSASCDWIKNALINNPHVLVMTHLKHTAQEIGGRIRSSTRNVLVCNIDGDLSPKRRGKAIEEVLASPAGVLITTMHAVKEGLNSLVGFDQALLAELYWSPGTMSQVLGRLYRVNGACNVAILVVQGTVEENIAWTLQKRMKDIGKAVSAGSAEKKLSAAFDEVNNEEDEFQALKQMAASQLVADEYGAI
jgi:superfamily II DNA or RNA helicase